MICILWGYEVNKAKNIQMQLMVTRQGSRIDGGEGVCSASPEFSINTFSYKVNEHYSRLDVTFNTA